MTTTMPNLDDQYYVFTKDAIHLHTCIHGYLLVLNKTLYTCIYKLVKIGSVSILFRATVESGNI